MGHFCLFVFRKRSILYPFLYTLSPVFKLYTGMTHYYINVLFSSYFHVEGSSIKCPLDKGSFIIKRLDAALKIIRADKLMLTTQTLK